MAQATPARNDKALKGLYATAEAVPEAAQEKNYQQNLTNALREAKLVERALQQAESVRAAKPVVTPQKIEAFSRSAKELLHGSNRAIAKQALQSIVVRVEVTDETIRILGENDQLSRLVASEGSDPEDGSDPASGVRGYVRRWRRECEFEPLVRTPVTTKAMLLLRNDWLSCSIGAVLRSPGA